MNSNHGNNIHKDFLFHVSLFISIKTALTTGAQGSFYQSLLYEIAFPLEWALVLNALI